MSMPPPASSSAPALRLTAWSMGLSAGFLAVLGAVAYRYGSKLAIAQAADSLADVFAAVVLLAAIRVSASKPDAEHPFGHHGAQPIAALIVAVLTGVLAVEVFRSAVLGLVGGEQARLGWPVVAAFALKVVGKAGVALVAARQQRRRPSPALAALRLDALNDVAVGSLAVAGYFAARYGHPSVDAWLAIPVALWIGTAGVLLALDNIRLLMGAAPPPQTVAALRAAIESIDGVLGITELKARYHGTSISVRTTIEVDGALTVGEAHDIGESVEDALLRAAEVSDAAVHIDPHVAAPGPRGPYSAGSEPVGLGR